MQDASANQRIVEGAVAERLESDYLEAALGLELLEARVCGGGGLSPVRGDRLDPVWAVGLRTCIALKKQLAVDLFEAVERVASDARRQVLLRGGRVSSRRDAEAATVGAARGAAKDAAIPGLAGCYIR